MPHTIRLAEPADLPQLAPLFDAYRQFYEQKPDLAHALRFLQERFERQESVVLLATETSSERTSHLLGFCQLYPSFCSVQAQPIYVLSDLFVTPLARRRGIGRSLLQAAAKQARSDGKISMDLTTARSNVNAQALYESLGWVRDEVFLTYHYAVV